MNEARFTTIRRILHTQPRWLLLAEAVVLTLIIGYFDFITGKEITMSLLYTVPILLVAWYADLGTAFVFVILSLVVWWGANDPEKPFNLSVEGIVLMLNRLGYFVFFAVGGTALKARRDADRARIKALERTHELEQEIVRISEHEQQRIGQDLHDGLCQHLAAIGCAAKSLADDLREKTQPEASDADQIELLLKEAVAQTRDLARGISPVRMDGSSLSAALEELGARVNRPASVAVNFVESGEVQVEDPEIAMHLYRIAQEAVGNAIKHSRAKHVVVGLRQEDEAVSLIIEDDGTGIPEGVEAGSGMGLRTMRYRGRLIGAKMTIESFPSGGTRISCVVQNGIHSSPPNR